MLYCHLIIEQYASLIMCGIGSQKHLNMIDALVLKDDDNFLNPVIEMFIYSIAHAPTFISEFV